MTISAAISIPEWIQFQYADIINHALPPLGKEIHIWRGYLPEYQGLFAQFNDALCDEERHRADNYRYAKDRIRFTLRRGILRQVLAAYLNCNAAAIEYTFGKFGKPALASAKDIFFNTSTSEDWHIIAISSDEKTGIDSEICKKQPALDTLVAENFSQAEQAHLRPLSGALWLDSFYQIWTCKEALLKAQGLGLIDDLTSITVPPHTSNGTQCVRTDAPEFANTLWQISRFTPFKNGQATLAYAAPSKTCRFYNVIGAS